MMDARGPENRLENPVHLVHHGTRLRNFRVDFHRNEARQRTLIAASPEFDDGLYERDYDVVAFNVALFTQEMNQPVASRRQFIHVR